MGSAFCVNSIKIWDYDSGYEKELEERTNWLDKWMATKQWDTCSRGSTDKRDSIKTVEMDTPINARKNQYQSPTHRPTTPHSPRRPATTSPTTKNKPLHIRPGSPRRLIKEEKSYSTANTPSTRSLQRLNSNLISRYSVSANEGTGNSTANIPSYMAATESAKARVRSQSAPRQRPSTPERERTNGVAKKRLSFPVPNSDYNNAAAYGYSQNLRSPSFKSVQAGHVGMEQHSYYTDSIGGEISPCSTTDLRRWFR